VQPELAPSKNTPFTIQVSPYDCRRLAETVQTFARAKTKALTMVAAETQMPEQSNYDYLHAHVGYKDTLVPKAQNVKNLGFCPTSV